jgi:hypothetical protein
VTSSPLTAIVAGQPLPDAEARELWQLFSAHMDVNEGDFDGFAASRGFRFARVAVEGTTPTLYLSNDEAPAPKTKTKTGPGRGKRTGPSRGKHSKRQKQGHKARR